MCGSPSSDGDRRLEDESHGGEGDFILTSIAGHFDAVIGREQSATLLLERPTRQVVEVTGGDQLAARVSLHGRVEGVLARWV